MIFIATPSYKVPPEVPEGSPLGYRGLDGEFSLCVERIRLAFERIGVASVFARYDAMMVDRARAEAVGAFLADPRYTHLLWIDADILIAPEVAEYMYRSVKAVTAVPYLRRGGADYLVYGHRVALGCSMMTRETIQRMALAHPELKQRSLLARWPIWALFQPMTFEGDGLGDDYSFCERLKALGVNIDLLCAPVMHDGQIGQYAGTNRAAELRSSP